MTTYRNLLARVAFPVGIVAASLTISTAANAATFMFTYSGTAGSGISGSGTLTTTTVNSTTELVTAITGFFRGATITGLAPVGSYFNNNNDVFPKSLGTFMGQPTYLNLGGLAFTTTAATQNIYFGLGGYGSIQRLSGQTGATSDVGGTFTLTAVGAAVPEPATWAMMLVGFGGVGFAMRRRSKVRQTVSYA